MSSKAATRRRKKARAQGQDAPQAATTHETQANAPAARKSGAVRPTMERMMQGKWARPQGPDKRSQPMVGCPNGSIMVKISRPESGLKTLSGPNQNRPLEGPIMADSQHICSIADCDKKHYARTFCRNHYRRLMWSGNPLGVQTEKGSVIKWCMDLISNPPEDCVLWPFGMSGSGYGVMKMDGATILAHRAVYRIYTGENPDMEAAHGPCHNRACVNPRHISWKTKSDNQRDRWRDGTMNTVISKEEIEAIRESKRTPAEISKATGLPYKYVWSVKSRGTTG